MKKKAQVHAMKGAADMLKGPVMMKHTPMSPEHVKEMMKKTKTKPATKRSKKQ